MCFAPYVSFSVAMLEFIFATLILIFFRKSKVTPYVIALIYLLGAYQFTEFMLCTTGDANLWVRLGFIAYTFLPMVGVQLVMAMVGSRLRSLIKYLYAIPIGFSAIAAMSGNFVEEGTCNTIFVTARTLFFRPDSNPIPATIYGGYYYAFILLSIIIVLFNYGREKSTLKRTYYSLTTFGLSLITISPLVFIIMMPAYGLRFPSVYCEFALIFAIIAFWASYLDHKHRIFSRDAMKKGRAHRRK